MNKFTFHYDGDYFEPIDFIKYDCVINQVVFPDDGFDDSQCLWIEDNDGHGLSLAKHSVTKYCKVEAIEYLYQRFSQIRHQKNI